MDNTFNVASKGQNCQKPVKSVTPTGVAITSPRKNATELVSWITNELT